MEELARHLAAFGPQIRDIADEAEKNLAMAREHGVPRNQRALELIATIDQATSVLEAFTRLCGENVPRIRAAVDELLRMHEEN